MNGFKTLTKKRKAKTIESIYKHYFLLFYNAKKEGNNMYNAGMKEPNPFTQSIIRNTQEICTAHSANKANLAKNLLKLDWNFLKLLGTSLHQYFHALYLIKDQFPTIFMLSLPELITFV